MPKKLKWGPLSLVRYCMFCGKNLLGSLLWANRYNLASSQNFVELLVELFWSLQVYRKTRRERLKSALYLRLKKRKVFKIVKGGPFRLFENPVCCKISKKIEGDPLETFKKIPKIFPKKNSEK